jgi:hypothetical protein
MSLYQDMVNWPGTSVADAASYMLADADADDEFGSEFEDDEWVTPHYRTRRM